MKKKFESNVASEIPRTKLHEPELPWKITSDDMAKVAEREGELKSDISLTSPLRTRAAFLILLVAAIFITASLLIINAVTENDKMRLYIENRQRDIAAMKTDIQKLSAEKEDLSKNAAQLEKKVNDLAAQKELFTSVIESLTKKSDDAEVGKTN